MHISCYGLDPGQQCDAGNGAEPYLDLAFQYLQRHGHVVAITDGVPGVNDDGNGIAGAVTDCGVHVAAELFNQPYDLGNDRGMLANAEAHGVILHLLAHAQHSREITAAIAEADANLARVAKVLEGARAERRWAQEHTGDSGWLAVALGHTLGCGQRSDETTAMLAIAARSLSGVTNRLSWPNSLPQPLRAPLARALSRADSDTEGFLADCQLIVDILDALRDEDDTNGNSGQESARNDDEKDSSEDSSEGNSEGNSEGSSQGDSGQGNPSQGTPGEHGEQPGGSQGTDPGQEAAGEAPDGESAVGTAASNDDGELADQVEQAAESARRDIEREADAGELAEQQERGLEARSAQARERIERERNLHGKAHKKGRDVFGSPRDRALRSIFGDGTTGEGQGKDEAGEAWGVSSWRPATAAEQTTSRALTATLQRKLWRPPARTRRRIDTPPGRLLVRHEMAARAAIAEGRQPDMNYWSHSQRHSEPPLKLKIGMLADGSGSMREVADQVGAYTWMLSQLAHATGGRLAAAIVGEGVKPIIDRNTRKMSRVPVIKADAGSEDIADGIAALEGELNFGEPGWVDLLLIVSDAVWVNDAQDREARERILRLSRNQVAAVIAQLPSHWCGICSSQLCRVGPQQAFQPAEVLGAHVTPLVGDVNVEKALSSGIIRAVENAQR